MGEFIGTVRQTIVGDFEGAQLGDERRSTRLMQIARRLEQQPQSGFPKALGTTAEVEAFYRFVNNDGFTATQVLEPHCGQTLARASQAGEVLVVHDTTHIEVSGHAQRQGFGVTTTNHFGFIAHFSLVLDAGSDRMPLGIAGMETYTRTGKKWAKQKKTRSKAKDDPERESLRWLRGVEGFEKARDGQFDAIHVMDAEADFFELLAKMGHSGVRFVVRAGQLDRKAKTAENGQLTNVCELIEPGVCRATRTVGLNARRYLPRSAAAGTRKRHPAREARTATLHISATTLQLPKTSYAVSDFDSVQVNVVRVWEPAPPPDCTAVEWVLFTTEPIHTASDLQKIVDIYRQRWVIEEFFKALKSGCALEQRQLETYEALVKTTAIFAPIAYRLLLLRSITHVAPDLPAAALFSKTELYLLQHDDSTRAKSPPKTIVDALMLLARMGGHLKNNGAPGWQILARGYMHLKNLVIGWNLANAAKTRRKM